MVKSIRINLQKNDVGNYQANSMVNFSDIHELLARYNLRLIDSPRIILKLAILFFH